jgi:hypothetical protein
LVTARLERPFGSFDDVVRRAQLRDDEIERLD